MMSDGRDEHDEESVESVAGPAESGGLTDRESRDRHNTAMTDPLEAYTTGRLSLSPDVRLLWGIKTTAVLVVIGLVIGTGIVSVGIHPGFALLVGSALVVAGAVWVQLRYRVWVYQIREDTIYLERGVFTHVRTLVPYVRIQHVDTSRGPLERALGLSSLVVYTAGSRGADVSVPGLTPAQARDLQQRVKELAIEAEGDDAL
jgi:membrane protein YdbS with pleckstrin-like domain